MILKLSISKLKIKEKAIPSLSLNSPSLISSPACSTDLVNLRAALSSAFNYCPSDGRTGSSISAIHSSSDGKLSKTMGDCIIVAHFSPHESHQSAIVNIIHIR